MILRRARFPKDQSPSADRRADKVAHPGGERQRSRKGGYALRKVQDPEGRHGECIVLVLRRASRATCGAEPPVLKNYSLARFCVAPLGLAIMLPGTHRRLFFSPVIDHRHALAWFLSRFAPGLKPTVTWLRRLPSPATQRSRRWPPGSSTPAGCGCCRKWRTPGGGRRSSARSRKAHSRG